MRINFYSQNDHALIINGLTISGFAEGDWLEVDVEGSCVVKSTAADGPVLNWVPPQGGKLLLSLLPTSKALGQLYSLRADFETEKVPFSITLMTGVKEIIKAGGCGFGKLPAFQSGGSVMSPRQFAFECLELTLDDAGVQEQRGGLLGGLLPINIPSF